MRRLWRAAAAVLLGAVACGVALACEEDPPPLSPADEVDEEQEEALPLADETEWGDASTYGCDPMPPHAGRCGPYRGIGPDASYPAGCTIRVGRCACTCSGRERNFWQCRC